MPPSRLELVRNADKRELRIFAESLTVALAAFVLFHLTISPALRSVAPAAFDRAIVENGRRPPETALGWVRSGILVVSLAAYLHYRLFHTALGETLQEKYRHLYGYEDR